MLILAGLALTSTLYMPQKINIEIAPSRASVTEEKKESQVPDLRELAKEKTIAAWSSAEWPAMDELIFRESRYKPHAQNPNSTAYGLGQFLNSTWKLVGCTKTSDPNIQLDCMVKYIQTNGNFHTPREALRYHDLHNSY